MTQLHGEQGMGGGMEGAFIDVSKIDPQKFANKPALAMVSPFPPLFFIHIHEYLSPMCFLLLLLFNKNNQQIGSMQIHSCGGTKSSVRFSLFPFRHLFPFLFPLFPQRLCLEIAAICTEYAEFKSWWWKYMVAVCYRKLGLHKEAEKHLLSSLRILPTLTNTLEGAKLFVKIDQPLRALDIMDSLQFRIFLFHSLSFSFFLFLDVLFCFIFFFFFFFFF